MNAATQALPGTPPADAAALARVTTAQWQQVLTSAPEQAAQWMRAAARLGHAEAQTVLGQWLLDGHGLARDREMALQWFLKAAAQNHAMGMNMAGRCYEYGWGAAPDLAEATRWYARAAHAGLDAGMYNYAIQLAAGKAVPQDHAAALDWYRKAADLGHAKSMTKIGRFYEDGLVVERDEEAAFFCYQQGAEGGDFRGQFSYAGMLAGRGRIGEALAWLRKVPQTATPAFMDEAGQVLLQSTHDEVRAMGQHMLARAAEAKKQSPAEPAS